MNKQLFHLTDPLEDELYFIDNKACFSEFDSWLNDQMSLEFNDKLLKAHYLNYVNDKICSLFENKNLRRFFRRKINTPDIVKQFLKTLIQFNQYLFNSINENNADDGQMVFVQQSLLMNFLVSDLQESVLCSLLKTIPKKELMDLWRGTGNYQHCHSLGYLVANKINDKEIPKESLPVFFKYIKNIHFNRDKKSFITLFSPEQLKKYAGVLLKANPLDEPVPIQVAANYIANHEYLPKNQKQLKGYFEHLSQKRQDEIIRTLLMDKEIGHVLYEEKNSAANSYEWLLPQAQRPVELQSFETIEINGEKLPRALAVAIHVLFQLSNDLLHESIIDPIMYGEIDASFKNGSISKKSENQLRVYCLLHQRKTHVNHSCITVDALVDVVCDEQVPLHHFLEAFRRIIKLDRVSYRGSKNDEKCQLLEQFFNHDGVKQYLMKKLNAIQSIDDAKHITDFCLDSVFEQLTRFHKKLKNSNKGYSSTMQQSVSEMINLFHEHILPNQYIASGLFHCLSNSFEEPEHYYIDEAQKKIMTEANGLNACFLANLWWNYLDSNIKGYDFFVENTAVQLALNEQLNQPVKKHSSKRI